MAFPDRSAGLACFLQATRRLCAGAAAATALAACAAAPSASSAIPLTGLRVIVKLAQPDGDPAAIAAAAAQRAGVPVRYAASVSAEWHALMLQCADAAACDAAIVRMRRSGAYASVEIDGHKRVMQ